MSKDLRANIIINNYNYGRFLAEAIDSALNQTYVNTEVIVVDDGSTDNSGEIIASYNDRIIPVLKENGGQSSAFNAGFSVSRGDIVIFLDSDDVLLRSAVEKAVPFFHDPDIVKVHWPLWIIDEQGRNTEQVIPANLPEGDLREALIREGPSCCPSPPTSGNAWSHSFLKRVFPISEMDYRLCADGFLFTLAMAFGPIKRILEPQGFYRVHGLNNYQCKAFGEKLILGLRSHDQQFLALKGLFHEQGISVDLEAWKRNSWFYRLRLAINEIEELIPLKEDFVLVDENKLGLDAIASRRAIPFLERDGQFWGRPPENQTAINELRRLRQSGASFMVFAWTAFWWLDYYSGLNHHLRSKYKCVLENDRIVVFDLRTEL